MKKRFIAGLLICFVLLCIVFPFSPKSYADPFTASQIASLGYAMMESWGISFSAGNATASGMNNFMSSQVENYVNSHGGSIADLFIGNIAVDAVGKLVVGYDMYNSIKEFVGWLGEKYNLSSVDFKLTDGTFEGLRLPSGQKEGTETITGVGIEALAKDGGYFWGDNFPYTYANIVIYNGGVVVHNFVNQGSYRPTGGYSVAYQNNIVVVYAEFTDKWGNIVNYSANIATVAGGLSDSLSWNGSNYVEPVVLNPGKEWTGNIGDYSVPDTNLDQLLGNINQAVADNNLVVDGEVIDVPIPPPTPEPIDPDTPLSDVPWEGMDTNLQNLYNQGLEEIGAIGDAQDAITDAIGVQTGTLEGAIADNAGVVSGAIDQAVSDIQDAIGDQTAALDQSMSATAEATESIADALEDETINWQKFDLRGLFPFCIPFDIYNMLEALDASPTPPHVELPFVIESIDFSYTIDLDFSAFDQVASVMRTMELIVYGIALAWATSKVIKW